MINFTEHQDNFYMYRARCVDCYDGDTCKLVVDLGFSIKSKQTCRLLGINTPELRGGTDETKAKGRLARDRLREKILNKDVIVYTNKDEKGSFGRLLAIIYTTNDKGEPVDNVNKMLIDEGHAVWYKKS